MRCDIFCTVIDNFGDIGIAWRLARQLAAEHALATRLWVDDLHSFSRFQPRIDPSLPVQRIEGVEVHFWQQPFPQTNPADLVIEAFGCKLPENYLDAMSSRLTKPVWINLEYLSAEDWVSGCHALPSPHPRLPLTQYFYFPGVKPGTGGLLHEAELDSMRAAFQASASAQDAFWLQHQLPAADPNETRISLFCYENAALASLLDTWAEGARKTRVMFPVGRALTHLAAYFDVPSLCAGEHLQRGNLDVHVLPMLSQDDYDRLLWACDCNFVRGEDSFVRAQWAQKPFIWQAYRQDDAAHWAKIDAFLTVYTANLPRPAAEALAVLWRNWNAEADVAASWSAFWRQSPALQKQVQEWSMHLNSLGNLSDNLMQFCREKL